MKQLLLLFIIAVPFLSAFTQEGHKINADIDLSFGIHYMNNKSDINNPMAIGGSLGYEYDFSTFLGVEIGIRGGGFNQSIGDDKGPNIGKELKSLKSSLVGEEEFKSQNLYKGSYWAPYIAPKLYYPISEDKSGRERYIFLENRFSYTRASMDLDKLNNTSSGYIKKFLQYEIRGGYQFPIGDQWSIAAWAGYNTFDFGKIKPKSIKYKNSTPIQLGIGFSYIIKHKNE